MLGQSVIRLSVHLFDCYCHLFSDTGFFLEITHCKKAIQTIKRSVKIPKNSGSNAENNHKNAAQTHSRPTIQLLKMVGIRSTKPKPASPLVRPPSQSEIDYEQDREMILEQITKTNLHYGTLIGDNIPSLTELDASISSRNRGVERAEGRMREDLNSVTISIFNSRKDMLYDLERTRNMLYVPTNCHEHHTISERTEKKRHERRLMPLRGLLEVSDQGKKPLKELSGIFTSAVDCKLGCIAIALSEPMYNALSLLFNRLSDEPYYSALTCKVEKKTSYDMS